MRRECTLNLDAGLDVGGCEGAEDGAEAVEGGVLGCCDCGRHCVKGKILIEWEVGIVSEYAWVYTRCWRVVRSVHPTACPGPLTRWLHPMDLVSQDDCGIIEIGMKIFIFDLFLVESCLRL